MGELVRAMTRDGYAKAVAVTTTDIVERARQIHKMLPTATAEDRKAAMEFISTAKNYIVEEYVTQHEAMAKMNPASVSIIRFYSVSSPAGNYVFAPVLTTAIEKSVANGCQDALTAMIDIRTGEVITDAVDQNQFVEYTAHPVTGVQFKGFQVPYWQECLALMRKALPLASKISNIENIIEDAYVLCFQSDRACHEDEHKL